MHRRRTGMSHFLLPLILSSLLIATSADLIPGVPDLSAGININTPTITPPQDEPPKIDLPKIDLPKIDLPKIDLPFPNPIPLPDIGINLPGPLQPGVSDPAPPPDAIAKQFLDLHNNARRHAKLPPYTWDVKLEEYARQYARQRAQSGECENLVHSDGPYGENLFWGQGSHWKPKNAVKDWIREHKFYSQRSNECKDGQMCGHYTQIVWRDSTRLGCAVERCINDDTFIVCSYDPPGNFVGEKPYFHYDH